MQLVKDVKDLIEDIEATEAAYAIAIRSGNDHAAYVANVRLTNYSAIFRESALESKSKSWLLKMADRIDDLLERGSRLMSY